MGRHAAGRHAGEGQPPSPPNDATSAARQHGGLTFRWPDPPGGGSQADRPYDSAIAVWPLHDAEASGDLGFSALSPEKLAPEHLADDDGHRRGFLGSGWNDEPQPPRRLRRTALLSGVSVLLAVGVTVGGVRLVAGRTTALTMDAPRSGCASSSSCGGAPAADALSATGPPATTDPFPPAASGVGSAGDGRDAGDGPSADPSAGPSADPTPAPKVIQTVPGVSRTKAAKATATQKPTTGAPPAAGAPSSEAATTQDVATTTGADSTQDPSQDSRQDTAHDSTHDSTQDSTQGTTTSATGPASVSLEFAVARQDEGRYTARLAVRNEAADLSSWTIELPISGEVVAVEGVQWQQRGGTLVITSDEPLARGDALRIAFDAYGTARPPAECTLTDGECVVAIPAG